MNVTLLVCLYLVGAAALGLWIVARFPSFGPRSVGGSLLLVLGAFAVLEVTDGVTSSVARVDGPAVAMLVVVLPTLTLALWSCARLVRALVAIVSPFR
jgi:hypothetical protein